jgi:hypothetical protein
MFSDDKPHPQPGQRVYKEIDQMTRQLHEFTKEIKIFRKNQKSIPSPYCRFRPLTLPLKLTIRS